MRIPGTRAWTILAGLLVLAGLAYGSWRDPHFWLTTTQQGDRLMAKQKFEEAAGTYTDPWRIGTAQFRNGDFEDAARTFARVPGATGAFNQGNAKLMHGAYDAAVQSYDRALGFRPGWQEAEDNRALAIARQMVIDDAGKDRDQESTQAYTPDDIVFDQKGDDQQDADPPQDMNDPTLSDASLRETWLRRVQTTPGDFLRAKFAYQAAHAEDTAP